MADYQNLSEFEHGVIIGTREMGYDISEKFEFSRTTILLMYREYRESGKTSNLRHRSGRKKIMQTIRKLMQILMLGHQQVSPCKPFNETSLICAFTTKGRPMHL
ncbi:uncharacterized protein TNCV_2603261 [Trichonephila clavipes]|nr:uncharacterized protein TNCV_2603261 [Trichonephila clavipes]